MKSFLQVLNDTEEKLGRQLWENEVVFLQWVYERYTEEEKQKINS